MTDNPYAPPVAPVSDVDPPVSRDRPPSVILAVRLLWGGFGLSVVVSLYGMFSLPDNAPRFLVAVMMLIGMAIGGAIAYGLFTAAWRGKAWARWAIAVFVAFEIAMDIYVYATLPSGVVVAWQNSTASFIRMAVYVAAIALLFSPTANAWYREMKRRR